ncbi:MAG: hypothetical protein E6772_06165 [Dysgonomonas sp.]|nr:hypothetical protein [Dysgonomonas sp.]
MTDTLEFFKNYKAIIASYEQKLSSKDIQEYAIWNLNIILKHPKAIDIIAELIDSDINPDKIIKDARDANVLLYIKGIDRLNEEIIVSSPKYKDYSGLEISILSAFECVIRAINTPTTDSFRSCAICFFDLLFYYEQFSDESQEYFNKLIEHEILNQEKYLDFLSSNKQPDINLYHEEYNTQTFIDNVNKISY